MGGSEEEGKGVKLVVGARGFEPPTSASRTLRANQTALRPASTIIGGFNPRCKLEVIYQGKCEGGEVDKQPHQKVEIGEILRSDN